ncbi:venom metalloproteinase antarease TserMP_A isoform X2 [Rhipicephalus microplus]|uniref:venom metalloproteinase antarease TserMP_A isoform X2 n=1 Tax=Rhipicephalus microplus TaxID=6941 RepID=UPI003F6B5687
MFRLCCFAEEAGMASFYGAKREIPFAENCMPKMASLTLLVSLQVAAASTVTHGHNEFTEKSITVFPRVLESREDGSEKVLIVHEGYSLHLRKASILARSLLLRDVTRDGVVEQYVNGAHYERHLYEDTKKKASLLLKPTEHGDYFITGLVNFTHRIEPAKLRERSSTRRAAHKIVQIHSIQGWYESDEVIERESREAALPEVEMRAAIAQEFGVELHFISDYNHTEHFRGNKDAHIYYVTLFLHSVSLRMDQLTPPVPISITKIQTTSTNPESYVKLWENGDLIGNETLKILNEVVQKDKAYQEADAVYMATGREMITLIPGGKSSYISGTAGNAKACSTEKAAVGEDKPGVFSGVNTAAHEIGHLLGSPDDSPGTWGNCETKDGYLMSKYAHGKQAFTFSNCSKKAIAEFLKSETSNCLRKKVSCPILSFPNKALKLPGHAMSFDAYCKALYPAKKHAFFLELFAFLKKCRIPCLVVEKNTNKLRFLTTLAPDGTRCDKRYRRRVCKNTICV